MTTIVTLLFIFQLVGFSLLSALYLKVKAKETDALKNQKMYEEMQKSLIVYIDEMKRENDRFLDAMNQQPSQSSTIEQKEENCEEEVEQLAEQWKKVRVVPPTLAHQRYQKEHISSQQFDEELAGDMIEDQDEILTLYKRGHTVEEIAKQLKLGKTEVELHIKFRT